MLNRRFTIHQRVFYCSSHYASDLEGFGWLPTPSVCVASRVATVPLVLVGRVSWVLFARVNALLNIWMRCCFSVSHALSWKMMKPHVQLIVQEILFPLMCHSDQDEELWQTDPVEYIRIKYGMVHAT